MSRVSRGTTKLKHRKNILKKTKGMRGNLHKKERQANEALAHAGNFAFQHRKKKKGEFRALWNVRINAGLKAHEISYSAFMKAMKEKGFELNRKMLATLAKDEPESFNRIVEEVKTKQDS